MHLRAALHAQACFECAASLALVYPDESNERATGGHIGAIDGSPAPVRGMVRDFCSLSPPPAEVVLGHGLFARAWVRGYVIHGEGASSASSPVRFVTASAQGKQYRGSARAQRVRSKRALEVAARGTAACLRCSVTVGVGAGDLLGRRRIGGTCCRDVRRGSGRRQLGLWLNWCVERASACRVKRAHDFGDEEVEVGR
eukprot:6211823-Pleurochrysis_carterae.AAC.1